MKNILLTILGVTNSLKKNKNKYIVFINTIPYGDNGHLAPNHIEEIDSSFVKIANAILPSGEIPSLVVMKAEESRLANDCVRILVESELGHIPYTIVPLEFLKTGSSENPVKIVNFLLERLKSESMIIVISQYSVLCNLPKIILEKTNKNPDKFLSLAALNTHNLKNNRALSFGFDKDCKLHSIHPM